MLNTGRSFLYSFIINQKITYLYVTREIDVWQKIHWKKTRNMPFVNCFNGKSSYDIESWKVV